MMTSSWRPYFGGIFARASEHGITLRRIEAHYTKKYTLKSYTKSMRKIKYSKLQNKSRDDIITFEKYWGLCWM